MTAPAPAAAIAPAVIDVRERIVEELIYERVQLDAELQELLELERDLGDSLRRAIAEAAPAEMAIAMTDRCIARVFRRLADEKAVELDAGASSGRACRREPICSPAYARAVLGEARRSR